MTKMTKRILSMVLCVLMLLSSVSAFVLPAAMAVEAPKTTDYDAIFESAYLINPEWHDGELVTDKLLYFTFRGEEREVVCDPSRCFNSWEDAYEAVYGIGKMDASNIYTVKPVFIFAPGTYSQNIHLPANATIMGNNAGISPNADIAASDWTAEDVKANDGWKKNSKRNAAETIFTGSFYPSTRTGASYTEQNTAGSDDSRFAYYLEAGKPASNPTISVEIDGVKVKKTSGYVYTMHHYDKGQSVKYPASATAITLTGGRICNMTIRNSVVDSTAAIFYSNNNAQNNVKAYVYDSEIVNLNAQIVNRDFSNLTMERVFWHNSGTSASIGNNSNLLGYNMPTYKSIYTTTTVTLKDNIFYELAGGANLFKVGSNYDRYHGVSGDKNREKGITHTVTFNNNIFFNAKSEKSNDSSNVISVVSHDETSTVNVNISNNIFHQEGKYVYTPVDKAVTGNDRKLTVTMKNNTVTGDFVQTTMGDDVYFLDVLAEGLTVNGVTFTKQNTAVYLSGTDDEQTAFFGGQKYIFEVDNKNIFALKKGADPSGYATGDRTVLTGLEGFKNKNIIMPSGDYSTIYFHIPANYYGANFGIDPVDKSDACAENNYDWKLNAKWGSTGETKLNTTNISRAITEGNLIFDGFTLYHRFYDDHRNTRTGDVNIKFINHVVNTNSTSASTSAGRTYNLNNALAQNANNADLGKVYNDSFTLENTFVVNTGINRDFMNEFICANVILDNVYLDNTAALKSRSAMGYAKLGGANLKHNYIVKNSNFRNGVGAGHLFQSNLYQTAAINDVPATYDTNAVFTNNIFYNATTGSGAIFSTYQVGYFTSITFDDNKVISTNNPTGYIITWDQNNTNPETVQLKGNFSFNNNTITGYAADKYIKPIDWGTDSPAATNVDGHNYDDGVASGEANCQQTATIRYTCTGCDTYGADCTYFKDVTGAAGKHVWNEGVYNNDATCQADGTKHVICTVDGCGAEDDIAAPGTKIDHEFKDDAYVADNNATCCKAGTKTAKCTWCEETNTIADADAPATNAHVWGEYVSDNNATYRADGTKTAKCTNTADGCTATDTVTDEGTKLAAPEIKDTSKTFDDVKAGKWYKDAVDHAVAYGLISGMDADTFGLNVTINRGMFITILARAAGVDTTNNDVETKFTDVAKGKYYTAAIKWASENGVVNGMTETTFAPTAAITRQQLAVMIVNFANQQKAELPAANEEIKFADTDKIAKWAKDAVVACQRAGIINGYNENGKVYFKPAASATRAEATQMLFVFHSEFYLK